MMIHYFPIVLAISAFVSLVSVRWIYFKVLRIAKVKGLVDNPDARKLQKEPIPVMGGVAVFFGVVVGMLVGSLLAVLFDLNLSLQLLPIVCAMLLMLYVGAMDDILGLSPRSRFAIEILAILVLIFAGGGCVDNFYGMWGVEKISWWIAVPLTVVAGVGIINAINMIDGVNGLSSGLCIVCSCMFGAAFVFVDDVSNAILAFSMAAALLPFLVHNVFGKKSRMFIGDAGTMVMGILLTWFTISTIRSDISHDLNAAHKVKNMIAMALAILSVPVFDTVRVMVMRMVLRKSPFHPDKTHLHHALVNVGLGHSMTSLIEISIDCLIMLIWVVTLKCRLSLEWQLYIVTAASMLLVWGVYGFIRWHAVRHTEFLHWLTHISISQSSSDKRWWLWLERKLDAPEAKYLAREAKDREEKEHRPVRVIDMSDPENLKERDRKSILDFLKGKAEVHVRDLVNYSGASSLRIYPLLFEEVQAGYVCVVEYDGWGIPEIVKLVED